MPTTFQINDPSLESQWRALILFGKNSATYKFAFAKSLLELVERQRTSVSLSEFADAIVEHARAGANINGVWNLVLADSSVNLHKQARIPEKKFLLRLYNRNEFYIESKHPLAETIINQTGPTNSKSTREYFALK